MYSSNDGLLAITEYKLIKQNNKYSMLEVILHTGRKNQIRVHMKDINHLVVGDKKYGINDEYKTMFLFANRISFYHPITKELIDIELDIPNEYLNIIKKGN